MRHTFTTISGDQIAIDSDLIEPFDFRKTQSSHYMLSDQFRVKGWMPKELIDAPQKDAAVYASFFIQTKTYNKLMYDPTTFRKLLAYKDEILKRPEFFLLRLPGLYINHEIKQENTTFTLGSLLESWENFPNLYSMDEMGEILLMAILHPQIAAGYRFRAWSPVRGDFTEIGISGFTEKFTREFESLNKRYPWQLKDNHTYALQLLKALEKNRNN